MAPKKEPIVHPNLFDVTPRMVVDAIRANLPRQTSYDVRCLCCLHILFLMIGYLVQIILLSVLFMYFILDDWVSGSCNVVICAVYIFYS